MKCAPVFGSLGFSFISFVLLAGPVAAQELPGARVEMRSGPAAAGAMSLTCDWNTIDPESHALTTTSEAMNLLSPRHDFWKAFEINSHVADLRDSNLNARDLAERARDLDPRNLMAHSILARQYLIQNLVPRAEEEWRTVLNGAGAVTWTATLHDVDAKSYFLMAFSRDALRIYRMGQFTGRTDEQFGVVDFPPPGETRFYEAVAGCADATVEPVATIPWEQVKEIKAGNWVIWLKLATPVTIVSDRNETKAVREIMVNLHGEAGRLTFLRSPNSEFDPRRDDESKRWKAVKGVAMGPYDYQQRVRDMIARFVDPAGRIKLTSSARGKGW